MKPSFFLIVITLLYSCRKHNTSPAYVNSSLSVDSIFVLQTNIPDDDYTDVTFVNEQTGFAISRNGKIVKTINGGLNWTSVLSPVSFFLKKIQFTDLQTGYIIGGDSSGAYLLKTTNGGDMWAAVKLNMPVNESPTGLHFIDANKGFITGKLLFIKTDNGGLSFSNALGAATGDFADVSFRNTMEGYATATEGIYYKTLNGGSSWQMVQTSSVNSFKEIYFAGTKTYIRAGSLLKDFGTGNEFKVPDGISRFVFLSEDKCIAAGQHYETGFWPYGDIFITNNAWRNFAKKTFPPSEAVNFQAIGKMSNNKTLAIGSGHLQNTVVLITH